MNRKYTIQCISDGLFQIHWTRLQTLLPKNPPRAPKAAPSRASIKEVKKTTVTALRSLKILGEMTHVPVLA
jgi:hypothetical protein